MLHQSSPLPFRPAAPTTELTCRNPRTCSTSSDSSMTSPPKPLNFRRGSPVDSTEPLGNKIQRLLSLSPGHGPVIEQYIDHLLQSVQSGNRQALR